MDIIRKISIGSDYKNAMHYVVGQTIYGNNIVHQIIKNPIEEEYVIWIERESGIMRWKSFNFNLPISLEYDINF